MPLCRVPVAGCRRLPTADCRDYDPVVAKPLLAMVLLTVMAGAWAWVLWPTPPSDDGITQLTRAAPPEPPVTAVRLEQLGRGSPGVETSLGADPFRGRTVPRSEPSRPNAAVPFVPAATSMLPEPPRWPRLELIGLAERQEDGRAVQTAILSGPAGVLHARSGDVLEQVYRVERIGPEGVDVRLLPEGRLLRLALRP